MIKFLAEKDTLLKQVKLKYNEKGCLPYRENRFYNINGLIEYAELWVLNCVPDSEKNQENKYVEDILMEYSRWEYDG